MAILNLTITNRNFSDELVCTIPLNMDTACTKHDHHVATAPVIPMDRHRPKSKILYLLLVS